MAKTRVGSGKKDSAAVETSESIASQTEAFLKKGGKIEPIKVGVSGIDTSQGGKKQMVISKKGKA